MKKKTVKRELELEILRVLEEMKNEEPYGKNYIVMTNNLKTLIEAQSKKPARTIEPEKLLEVGSNIAVTLVVLNHEKLNNITTKLPIARLFFGR